MSKSFYNNKGPKILDILKTLNLKDNSFTEDIKVFDVKDLFSAKSSDISFLHSKKYKDIAKKTKASFCITTNNLKNELPKNCKALIVENVLVSTAKITALFYPNAINDNFDETVSNISETEFNNKVKFGKNVLIVKNFSIGSNCSIGHNTIIEKNVSLGENCSIGSNTIIRNSLIKIMLKS